MNVDSEIKEDPTTSSNPKPPANATNKPMNPKAKSTKPAKKSRKRKLSSIEDTQTNPQNPKKKRKKSRNWSVEEEKLFREGLSLYGRNWPKISSHVGNDRNPASIRSHAQIYFLKKLSKGEPLCDKVLQSGNGYTLSGKALNKYSSVAIRHFGSADKVPMVDGVISDAENAPKKRTKKPKKIAQKKPKKNKKKKRKKYYDSDSDEEFSFKIDINPTTTATRRSGRNRKKIHTLEPSHVSQPFGLRTDIQIYDDLNLSDKPSKNGTSKIFEPFKIEYCVNALLVADIHSHLLRSVEIMGLLGGTYDSETRVLRVRKCYPLKEEDSSEQTVSAHSTEMLSVSESISRDGYALVGWYHSHPCFENVPSNLDCHQHSLNKSECESERPYVGLIVQSLWDRSDGLSDLKWFNTLPLNSGVCDREYIALEFRARESVISPLSDSETLFAEIKALIERYDAIRYDVRRANFGLEGIGERVKRNIRERLNGNGSDKSEMIDAFVERVWQLFVDRSNVWWPKKEESEKEIKEESVTENSNNGIDDKENENCLND